MHSCDCTTADGVSFASNTALMVKLFPVASTPWTSRVEGLERQSRADTCLNWSFLHGIASFRENRISSGRIDIAFVVGKLL